VFVLIVDVSGQTIIEMIFMTYTPLQIKELCAIQLSSVAVEISRSGLWTHFCIN